MSNFDLVTESLTLIAGHSSVPFFSRSYRRCTPVVVSSVTPWMASPIAVHMPRVSRSVASTIFISSESASVSVAHGAAFSNSVPRCTSIVASPPSSRIMFGPFAVGPAEGLLEAPPVLLERLALPGEDRNAGRGDGRGGVVLRREDVAARPAHLAPSAVSVSISTAVWIVMWIEPVMRAPASGWLASYSARSAIRPGISSSARTISLRPNSAREMSATL